jgi:phospholipid/cholesterol/gamma-HCH transport system permease protein
MAQENPLRNQEQGNEEKLKGGSPGQPSEWAIARRTLVKVYKDFFYWLIKGPFPYREWFDQFREVILGGLPTMFFGSMVIGIFVSWIAGFYGDFFGAYIWIGTVANFAVFREFSVLMISMLFAGRIGTAFTVEIGSMNMSEQVQALKIMDVEPNLYLVIPRVMASTLALPLFVAMSFGIAILFSWVFLYLFFDTSFQIFFDNAFVFIEHDLMTNSLIRSTVIGFFIGLNAVGLGFYPCEGAVDLGRSTTKSIVINLFTLMLLDLFIGMAPTLWS